MSVVNKRVARWSTPFAIREMPMETTGDSAAMKIAKMKKMTASAAHQDVKELDN